MDWGPLVFRLLRDYVHIWPNHKYVYEVYYDFAYMSFISLFNTRLFSFDTHKFVTIFHVYCFQLLSHIRHRKIVTAAAIAIRIINKYAASLKEQNKKTSIAWKYVHFLCELRINLPSTTENPLILTFIHNAEIKNILIKSHKCIDLDKNK